MFEWDVKDLKVGILDNMIWVLLLGSIVGFSIAVGSSFLKASNLKFIAWTELVEKFISSFLL